MARPPDPVNRALEDQVLAVLRDAPAESQGWLSTFEVAEAVGIDPVRASFEVHARLYPRLDRLRRAGRIHRGSRAGFRIRYWRSVDWRSPDLPPPLPDLRVLPGGRG